MKGDLDLQSDVLDELQWEPSVNAANIGVTARHGVVTLTGSVPTFSERLMAEKVAKRVHGVKAIANDIEVNLALTGERTDTHIAEAAVEALKWNRAVPSERIKVSVSKGRVTLEGEVEWQFQKEAAEEAVRHLHGVRGLVDLIALKPTASAAQIKSRIELAFRRSAVVDAQRVRVETHGGKAILRGDVRSLSERQEAERTAWAAPGITQVENHITVLPAAGR